MAESVIINGTSYDGTGITVARGLEGRRDRLPWRFPSQSPPAGVGAVQTAIRPTIQGRVLEVPLNIVADTVAGLQALIDDLASEVSPPRMLAVERANEELFTRRRSDARIAFTTDPTRELVGEFRGLEVETLEPKLTSPKAEATLRFWTADSRWRESGVDFDAVNHAKAVWASGDLDGNGNFLTFVPLGTAPSWPLITFHAPWEDPRLEIWSYSDPQPNDREFLISFIELTGASADHGGVDLAIDMGAETIRLAPGSVNEENGMHLWTDGSFFAFDPSIGGVQPSPGLPVNVEGTDLTGGGEIDFRKHWWIGS